MQLFNQDLMDCPNCGRKCLVRQNNDIYQCLCCSFRRNLSEPSLDNVFIWVIFAFVVVTLLFGGLQTEEHNDSLPQMQSPNSLSDNIGTG